jgi:plasmid stabilization system protein ParE
MPPLPVELDPRAEEEARVAFLWYLERSERAAAAFEREIERAIERIGQSPEVYPITEDELRRYLLDRFPYTVLYAIGPANVRIVAISHQHRRPGYWLPR